MGHKVGTLEAVGILDDPDRKKGQRLARVNARTTASHQRVQELVEALDVWLHQGAERPKRSRFLSDLEAEVGRNIVPQ
jgi:uncharacterized heparinase superfamily protein